MLCIRSLWVAVFFFLAGSLAAQTKGDAAKVKPSSHAEEHAVVYIWLLAPIEF